MIESLPRADYFVFLTRSNRRPETEVWPIALTSALPTVRVPLCDPDPDVPLDLQQAFEIIYELSPYGAAIDYSRPAHGSIMKPACPEGRDVRAGILETTPIRLQWAYSIVAIVGE